MLKRISLDQIRRNPNQPRQTFNRPALEDLANSIAERGLQQPITVRVTEDAERPYMIVMGERRFRAHLILAERGMAKDIVCHLKRMDEADMDLNAIIENLQREDVSPLEEGRAFQRVMDSREISRDELAKLLGIRQSCYIRYRVSLLSLTDDNQELVAKGIISMRQGVAMSRLSPNGQNEFAKLCAQGLASTQASAEAAAAAIAAKEAEIDLPINLPIPKRTSVKSVEDRIERLGAALQPLFKDGPFKVDGRVVPDEAQRCIEKLKLAMKHMRQIEGELTRAASVAAAGA